MSISVQNMPQNHTFLIEMTTQSPSKTVLINQGSEGLKVGVKTAEGAEKQIPRYMLQGLPKAKEVPQAFFEQCHATVSENSVRFNGRLKGGGGSDRDISEVIDAIEQMDICDFVDSQNDAPDFSGFACEETEAAIADCIDSCDRSDQDDSGAPFGYDGDRNIECVREDRETVRESSERVFSDSTASAIGSYAGLIAQTASERYLGNPIQAELHGTAAGSIAEKIASSMVSERTSTYSDGSQKTSNATGTRTTYSDSKGNPIFSEHRDLQDGDFGYSNYHKNGLERERTFITDSGTHTVTYDKKGGKTNQSFKGNNDCNIS